MKTIKETMVHTLLLLQLVMQGCHTPVQDGHDRRTPNLSKGDLMENPLILGVITTSVNLNTKTMSTLYGNAIAVDHAQGDKGTSYPTNAVLYEVSWKQQPDSLWFGALIPGTLLSVEKVHFTHEGHPIYTLYKGDPLKRMEGTKDKDRSIQIISRTMAQTP